MMSGIDNLVYQQRESLTLDDCEWLVSRMFDALKFIHQGMQLDLEEQ